jgi:hypothetical protein
MRIDASSNRTPFSDIRFAGWLIKDRSQQGVEGL